jgi:hypothetical protein
MKKIEIEGYGQIFLNGIDFKRAEGKPVDKQGNPLTRFNDGGVKGVSGYKDINGNVISSKEVCKSFNIKGEDQVVAKLKATDKLGKSDLIEKSRADAIYAFNDGGERKLYVVNTNSKELRDYLNEDKAFIFAFVAGAGHKGWKGIITKHTTRTGKDQFILGCAGGSIDKALDAFADEPIEVEIGITADNGDVKKLVDLD